MDPRKEMDDIMRRAHWSFIWSLVLFVVLPGLIILLVWSCAPTPASAHDWYSFKCCSNNDCHPIESCDEITENADGSATWQGMTTRSDNVYPSKDAHCHVCVIERTMGGPALLCVYTVQGS